MDSSLRLTQLTWLKWTQSYVALASHVAKMEMYLL